jgi:hypothetical protein
LKSALFTQEKEGRIGLRRSISGRVAVKNKSYVSYYLVTHKMHQHPPDYLLRHLWLSFPEPSGIELAREFDASWVQDASNSQDCRQGRPGESSSWGVVVRVYLHVPHLYNASRAPSMESLFLSECVVSSNLDAALVRPTRDARWLDQRAGIVDSWTCMSTSSTHER